MITRLLSLFFIFELLLLSSCTSSQQESADTNTSDSTIIVTVTPTMDCLPLFVAAETTIDDSLGVRLVLNQLNSRADCDTALLKGRSSAILTDYVRADALRAEWNKTNKDSLSVFSHENLWLYLFTNAKSRIREAHQLADKMIALDRHSSEAVLAQHVLDSVKLTGDKCFLVEMRDYRLRIEMLRNNGMDALVFPEPQASIARLDGHPSLYSAGQYGGRSFGCMVVKDHGDLIRRLYNAGCDSINERGLQHYGNILLKYYELPVDSHSKLSKRKFYKL